MDLDASEDYPQIMSDVAGWNPGMDPDLVHHVYVKTESNQTTTAKATGVDEDHQRPGKKRRITQNARPNRDHQVPAHRPQLREETYKRCCEARNAHDITTIWWRSVLGGEAFDRAFAFARRVIRAKYPEGIRNFRMDNNYRRPSEHTQLLKQIRDDKEVADLFAGPFTGIYQQQFYRDRGPLGIFCQVNKKLQNAASQKRRDDKEAAEQRMLTLASRKQSSSLGIDKTATKTTGRIDVSRTPTTKTTTSPSKTKTTAPSKSTPATTSTRPSSHQVQRKLRSDLSIEHPFITSLAPSTGQPATTSWQVWVHRASNRTFIIAMAMEDVFYTAYPTKASLSYEKLTSPLADHPDLKARDLTKGFVYADCNRNYPIYNTVTLRFAFEQWRKDAVLDGSFDQRFHIYLEDRTWDKDKGREVLPVLATEPESQEDGDADVDIGSVYSDDEDYDHDDHDIDHIA